MPEDVLNKHFIASPFTASSLRRGDDEREVDEFLDEIVGELLTLSCANDDLRVRLNACQECTGDPPRGRALVPRVKCRVGAGRRRPER
jgi:DivIVA domain-containing protein